SEPHVVRKRYWDPGSAAFTPRSPSWHRVRLIDRRCRAGAADIDCVPFRGANDGDQRRRTRTHDGVRRNRNWTDQGAASARDPAKLRTLVLLRDRLLPLAQRDGEPAAVA